MIAAALVLSTGCQQDSGPQPTDVKSTAAQLSGPGRAAAASPTMPPPASALADPRLVLAVRAYDAYLRAQAAALAVQTRPFTDAIRAGDRTAARKRFAASRTSWERIQSVGFLLPELDRRIDARADDFASAADPAWTGWHRLEHILWIGGGTADAASLATRLDRDLELLRKAVPTLDISPKLMAAGIARLVDEAITEKLPGAEDRYSRVDLADLAANLQGARAGYATLAPVLAARDADATRLLDRQFAAVDRTIGRYRTPTGYRPYPALATADRALLRSQLSALAETLTLLSAAVER
ncbi:MAG TPA: imelysin family protein [Mycobacteriales bacterium]|jgi:iron uptake system component EfeO